MRKTIAFLCIAMFLFTVACGKQAVNETSTETKTNPETFLSTNQIETTGTFKENPTSYKETSKTTNSTTKTVSQKDTAKVPPYILAVELNELKQIKNAVETMNEQEFNEYMSKNFASKTKNGMNTLDNTKSILNELEGTYMPVLDGNENNFSVISFYLDYNEVHQLTYFEEPRRIVAYSQTPKYDTQERVLFGEYSKNAVLVKNIENDTYKAKVYITEGSEHFYVDLFIEDSYIYLRTHDIDTIEEFEADFSRLKFVKIGDLLNE